MKVVIIGAGASGLIAEKYALEEGLEVEVFEQTGTIGGTWIYTDSIGVDENGLPIHSSMYKDLMTNLPKETMTILDFPYPEQQKSYIPQSEVVDYFNSFADRFNLRSHIKFYKYIKKVTPLPGNKWSVTVQDVKTKEEETYDYDAVFVCNGHYHTPRIPEIPGKNLFKGVQLHSHVYRTSEPFRGKRVLVIGAGASGQDIACLIAKAAEHVLLSHKGTSLFIKLLDNMSEKTVVASFLENGAVFEDGSTEQFDVVLYCTGYKYLFPFLTDECGIKIDDNWVHPLYKHIINIEHPTMYFLGIPFLVCVIPMFDIQARFALAALTEKFVKPSKDEMRKELEELMVERKNRGIPQRHAHQIAASAGQRIYFQDLSEISGIRNIPSVVTKLYARVKMMKNVENCFKIVDDDNFIQIA